MSRWWRVLRNAFLSPGARRFGFAFSRDYLRFAWRARRTWGSVAPGTLQLLGWTVEYLNQRDALFLVHELFVNDAYAFVAATPAPRIVDVGANVGFSVLFFKALYPDATVVAYEPDAEAFAALAHNVERNALSKVSLVCAAVSDRDGSVAFHRFATADGTMSGSVEAEIGGPEAIEIPAVRLGPALTQPVDLLKMDIEGGEYAVFRDLTAGDLLSQVRAAVIEYHALPSHPQRIEELVAELAAAGFTVTRDAPPRAQRGMIRAVRPRAD